MFFNKDFFLFQPLALILVSSWKKAQAVYDITRGLLRDHKRPRPLIIYGGGCEHNQFVNISNSFLKKPVNTRNIILCSTQFLSNFHLVKILPNDENLDMRQSAQAVMFRLRKCMDLDFF